MYFCNAKLGNDKKNDKCEGYAINEFSKLVRMGSPCLMLMNALYNLCRSEGKNIRMAILGNLTINNTTNIIRKTACVKQISESLNIASLCFKNANALDCPSLHAFRKDA